MVQTATSFTHTYTSDIPDASLEASGCSHGILYGSRPPGNGKRQATIFCWIDDEPSLQTAVDHLTGVTEGYDPDTFIFIPYSSKEAWCTTYPHAKLSLECTNSQITFHCNVKNTQMTQDKKRKRKRRSKKKSDVGIESHPYAVLTNTQRDLLHLEIYKYMNGLHHMLTELEGAKNRLGNICATSTDVAELMECTMKTFGKVIECNFKSDEDWRESPSLMEQALGEELEGRLEHGALVVGSHSREAGLTFEEYYERLLAFKKENGHVNVPNRYKDRNLANWVHDVRRNKKDMDKAAAKQDTSEPPTKKSRKSQYIRPSALNPQRIAQLESLDFAWGVRNVPQHVSWEDRFKQVMEFYQTNGCWPPHSLSGLGSWVKHQRRRWSQKEPNFMEKYYPRLEAVGFVWRGKSSKNHGLEQQQQQQLIDQTNVHQFHGEEQEENYGNYGVVEDSMTRAAV